MIEILIISILITVWLFAVRKAIDHAKLTNIWVMQNVIANQLATEWAEILYQVRNTNFLEYYYNENEISSDNLNQCRLSYDFWECLDSKVTCSANWEDMSCTDASRLIMQSWNYYITNSWWKHIINNCLCDAENNDCDNIKIDKYAICLNDWIRVPCPQWHEEWNDQSKYWKFYRKIKWLWSYNMWSNSTWWEYIESSFCSNAEAQEYRFCSIVARDWWQWWEVEICSTMTNFAEIDGTIVK